MNKSASGSSIQSQPFSIGGATGNAIEVYKLERLDKAFALMKRDDDIINLISLAMNELKNLIQMESLAIFVLDPNHS